jgi:hypothetical protein
MRAPTTSIAAFTTLAIVLLFPAGAFADFPVAYTSGVETSPSVAHDSTHDRFAVAYLRADVTTTVVEVRRFGHDGSQIGSVIQPFGTGLDAVGRPEIVYNPLRDEYLVVAVGSGTSNDDVAVRRIDADGNVLPGPDFLFTGRTNRRAWDPRGVGAVRAAYNSLLAEFVVTAQLDTGSAGNPARAIWGQTFASDMTSFGPEVKLTSPSDLAVWSHSIAYAPQASSPTGGRYLLAYSWDTAGESRLALLDVDLADIVHPIPFDWGSPAGKSGFPDVAHGIVQGRATFLVVWSDGDNQVGDPPEDWTGIWGSHVDPSRTEYESYPENEPFPISYIPLHYAPFYPYHPRVAFNASAQAFLVTWPETPSNVPENEADRCTHIRANIVDFLDFEWALHPYPNVVVSDVTCDCLPQPEGPPLCDSLEDPRLPDVAPLGSGSAVAVWQQNYPPQPSDQDVMADFFGYSRPSNDDWTSAEVVPGLFAQLDCSIRSASPDGEASCGASGEPDVWYKYTAPSHGVLTVATCGTNDMFGTDAGMDTVLSLHEPVQADPIGACNDDWPAWDPSNGCEGLDEGNARDSFLTVPMVAGDSYLIRLSRYQGSTGGACTLMVRFSEGGGGAGHVPADGHVGGTPLRMSKGVGGDITLTWDPSCLADDQDYEVYAGILGAWGTHEPLTCTTGGLTSFTFPDIDPGSKYYLVVPHNGMFEGSYGLDGAGAERLPGLDSCRPHNPNSCP